MKYALWLLAAVIITVMIGGAARAHQPGLPGQMIATCFTRADAAVATLLTHADLFDCTTPQRRLGAGDFWAISRTLPATAGLAPQSVRFGSLWQDRVTLYALYADGRVRRATIDGHGATRRLQMGAIVEQPLPVLGVPVVRLLWHVEGAANLRGILVGARLATRADGARSNLQLAALYAAFAGLCVALVIYNLALWAALRNPFQIAYCAMVAGLLLYAASSSGAVAWAWPGIANNDRLRINYVGLSVSIAAALVFARGFFEARVFDARLTGAMAVAAGSILASGLAFAALAPWQIALLDRLHALAFIGTLGVVALLLWRAWRTRSRFLWPFVAAWGAPLTLGTIRAAGAFGTIDWNFWFDNSTLIAMTLEALVSSLIITYRLRLLSTERDEARDREIQALRLAGTDPLTGLLNRRAFLAQAVGRSGEQMLLLVDIDHFKAVNEAIGHDGGDEVLRVFARTLRAAVPGDALVARIGGEEFAIVVDAQDAVSGSHVLDRLRRERLPLDRSVTASIGTCTGSLRSEDDWQKLYACADTALFEAKAAGRNRSRDALTARAA